MDAARSFRCALPRPHVRSFSERYFPVPKLLFPRGAGVDISDNSIKWLSLKPAKHGYEVDAYSEVKLADGIVSEGIVRDPQKLGEAIAALQKQAKGGSYAHAALPEETAFVFTMHVVDVRDRKQVVSTIEFELEDRVPLKIDQAVYDYDIVAPHPDGMGAEISVSVFPKTVVEGYQAAFQAAGVTLLSLELEASSVARSILQPQSKEIVLALDFGRSRTGIMIINRGIPIFTSTVMVGGDAMTKVIMEALQVDEQKAVDIKNEDGIAKNGDPKVVEAVASTAAALADEVARHYEYWDTRRDDHGNRVTPISRVIMTGGSSNLKGLDEYIAGRVKAPAAHADVWTNVCSYDVYIPPIDHYYALGLSTAIGLALRGI